MSINVLLGSEEHSAADDLESFFYVLLFLCLEYSGPGRRRDWDICKTDLRHWIKGDFRTISQTKSSDVISAVRFRSTVLENIPPYFQDLGTCLDDLRRYIFLESELSRRPANHDGFIKILEARSQGSFDETVEEEATSSTKKSKRSGKGVIDAGSRRTEHSEMESDDDTGDSDVKEDGHTKKRDRMGKDHDDEGGGTLQDDNEDEIFHTDWPAKCHRSQAPASGSDPAPTKLPRSQLCPSRSSVHRQSSFPAVSNRHPPLAATRPARSFSGLPVARAFNSGPIPPERFYAVPPQRKKY